MTMRIAPRYLACYGFVSLFSLLVLFPVSIMVISAFKTRREMFTDPLGLPGQPGFAAFARALEIGLGGYMLNSLVITGSSVVVILFTSAAAAWVLARVRNTLTRLVYLLLVIGFAVPVAAVLVPFYQLMSATGMINNQFGVVLAYCGFGIPFSTILFFAFFLDFPTELEEAARLDGCSGLQIFFRIVVPLSGPAIASAAIFQTVFIWNEFLIAFLMLTDSGLRTLPLGLLSLSSEYSADWPAMMAGLCLSTLPVLAIFVLLQKHFVKSLAGFGR